MNSDRTDQLLDLLYDECTAEEAARIREEIEEDEALAQRWEELKANRDRVQSHVPPPQDVPDEVQASILEKASKSANKSAANDATAANSPLPWRGMAVAAMALLVGATSYYLVYHIAQPPGPGPVGPTAESVVDEAVLQMDETQVADDGQQAQPAVESSEEAIAAARQQAEDTQQQVAEELSEEDPLQMAELQDALQDSERERAPFGTRDGDVSQARSAGVDESDSPMPDRAGARRAPASEPSVTAESEPSAPAESEDLDQGDMQLFGGGSSGGVGGIGRAAGGGSADSGVETDAATDEPEDDPEEEETDQQRANELLERVETSREYGDDNRARRQIESLFASDLFDELDDEATRRAEELRRELDVDE